MQQWNNFWLERLSIVRMHSVITMTITMQNILVVEIMEIVTHHEKQTQPLWLWFTETTIRVSVFCYGCNFLKNYQKYKNSTCSPARTFSARWHRTENLKDWIWRYIATYTNGFTDEYREKYEHFEELQFELGQVKAEYESVQARTNRFRISGDVLTEFDDSIWNAVIANIIVFHDGSMVFQFKDGTEIKE